MSEDLIAKFENMQKEIEELKRRIGTLEDVPRITPIRIIPTVPTIPVYPTEPSDWGTGRPPFEIPQTWCSTDLNSIRPVEVSIDGDRN